MFLRHLIFGWELEIRRQNLTVWPFRFSTDDNVASGDWSCQWHNLQNSCLGLPFRLHGHYLSHSHSLHGTRSLAIARKVQTAEIVIKLLDRSRRRLWMETDAFLFGSAHTFVTRWHNGSIMSRTKHGPSIWLSIRSIRGSIYSYLSD